MLTKKDFDEIEKKLKIILPTSFKEFHLKKIDLIETLHKTYEWEQLSIEREWIIESNEYMSLPFDREDGLCKNKIIIGTDGCGNDSVISLDNSDPRVFVIDHEIASELISEETLDFDWDNERMTSFPNLEEYVIEIIRRSNS